MVWLMSTAWYCWSPWFILSVKHLKIRLDFTVNFINCYSLYKRPHSQCFFKAKVKLHVMEAKSNYEKVICICECREPATPRYGVVQFHLWNSHLYVITLSIFRNQKMPRCQVGSTCLDSPSHYLSRDTYMTVTTVTNFNCTKWLLQLRSFYYNCTFCVELHTNKTSTFRRYFIHQFIHSYVHRELFTRPTQRSTSWRRYRRHYQMLIDRSNINVHQWEI